MTESTPIAAPRISVIVCTHGDRLESFELLIAALRTQSIVFELVVVLGRASDRLRRAVTALSGVARVAECPEPNVSRARNVGIRAASGDIVVFIDDDAVPAEREWLARLTAPLTASGRVAAAGGAVVSGHSDRVEFNAGATSSCAFHRFGPGEPGEQPPDGGVWWPGVPGGNCAFLAPALRQIGGFDEQYAYYLDETDVCVRLLASGYDVVAVDHAAIRHYPAPSVHGPARLRSRRLIARSDGYFVMRHASGSRPRRAWLALRYLSAKAWFREGTLRRRAGLLSATELAKFRAHCVAGLVSGIWAGSSAGPTLLDDAAPASTWQPLPRETASRGTVFVAAPSVTDAGAAMTLAAVLYRQGYHVPLLTADDSSPSAPPPPGLEDAGEAWAAAWTAATIASLGTSAPDAAFAGVSIVIESVLVARMCAGHFGHVMRVVTGSSTCEIPRGPLARWLCEDDLSGRPYAELTMTEAQAGAFGAIVDAATHRVDGTPNAPGPARLLAHRWLARLRDDRTRDPGVASWALVTPSTWHAVLALVRHCLLEEAPRLVIDLAAEYRPHLQAADPALAAELDYHAARAWRAIGQDAEARRLYQSIRAAARTGLVPRVFHAGACYHLAVAAHTEGRFAEADGLLTECLELQPDHGAARRLLEQIQRKEISAA